MLWHWLTTGWRQLLANPLFTVITIASLSIGCCGALLAGANIRQHLSFEQWIPDAQNIVLERETMDAMGEGLGEEARLFRLPLDMMHPGLLPAIEGKITGMKAQTRVFNCNTRITWPDSPPPAQQPSSAIGGANRAPPPVQTRCVDPGFFDVFQLDFIEGSRADALKAPDSLVISERVARKYFGNALALGKTFPAATSGASIPVVRVTGVFRERPETHLALEAIATVALQVLPGGRSDLDSLNVQIGGQHYIRFSGETDLGVARATAARQIQTIMDEFNRAEFRKQMRLHPPTAADMLPGVPVPTEAEILEQEKKIRANTVSLVPILDIHLGGDELTGVVSSGDVSMLTALGAAAAALLAVSAFNYVTLSLARSMRRRREVGVRKALGASQGNLLRHYLSESAVVTAISLVIGLALAELLHPWFARTIGQPETLFEVHDPVFMAGALGVFALMALAVGVYPAIYLAGLRPRIALDQDEAAPPAGLGRFVSGGLLGLQVGAASVLLALGLTMAAQSQYVANRPLGFDVRDKYTLYNYPCPLSAGIPDNATQDQRRAAAAVSEQCRARFFAFMRGVPGITNFASSDIVSLTNDSAVTQAFGRSAKGEELGKAADTGVDLDFLPAMGAKLLAGRLFDPNSAFDRAVEGKTPNEVRDLERIPAVVTRAMLPLIGAATPEAAIGQRIQMKNGFAPPYEIVGVVEDWHQRSLKYKVHPIIFFPKPRSPFIIFEITDPEPEQLLGRVRKEWGEMMSIPENRLRNFTAAPAGRGIAAFYEADRKLMSMVLSFSSLAMLVAAVGVFGLSAFEMQRRVREIGIRKALGASPAKVAGLAIGRAVLFAAVATVLAWPVAWWVSQTWLETFVYRTVLGPALLPLSSGIIVAALALAVSFNAFRAAAIRPSLALRGA
jgi:putative ABC transport system permease protein